MSKIIHCMIRVLDLNQSLKFYADCLNLRPAHRLDFPTFSLVYLRNATWATARWMSRSSRTATAR